MRLDLITEEQLPVSVGRYEITGLLGEGGMARVFRAEMSGELGFRRPAALKVVLPARGERLEELRTQLVQEARVGGLLNHPNVVQTFDCGELEGFPYIAMELVEGTSLSELVDSAGPLQPQLMLDVAIQACRGLHHAHFAAHDGRPLELIPRDVKPSNILMRGDGVVKLVDFGIAKAQMADAQATASGMTKGTPSYMSPEQLNAERLDLRSDLFTLGAVIWFGLTGRTLFTGSSLTEVMMRIIRVEETLENFGTLSVVDGIASGMGEVFRRLLTRERDARYATALELEGALQAVAARLPRPDRSLAQHVSEHFSGQLSGWRGPVPGAQSQPSGPGPSLDTQLGSTATVPGLSTSRSEPGPTRAFPATGSPQLAAGSDLLPPTEVPGGAPLSTQSRPAFRGATGLEQASAGESPDRSLPPEAVGTRKMARQEEAIRSQRRLLGLLAAALSAMIFLFGFLAWYLFGREPEPTFASADMEQSEGAEIPDLLMDEAAGEGVELASLDPDPAEDSSGSNGAAAGGSRPNSAAASAGGTASGSRREPAAKVEAPTDSGPVAAADKPDLSVEKTSPATRKTDAPSADAGTAGLRRKPSVEADRSQQETAAEPLALRIAHKPVSQAALGSTKRLEVKVEGPDDTRVVLHYGVEGDWKKKTMKRGAGSVYSCSFSFDSPGKLYYWVVAQHPETRPRRALSGQRFEPHVVSVY